MNEERKSEETKLCMPLTRSFSLLSSYGFASDRYNSCLEIRTTSVILLSLEPTARPRSHGAPPVGKSDPTYAGSISPVRLGQDVSRSK
jgi:hypothetical protein